jgi:hypothetical protein
LERNRQISIKQKRASGGVKMKSKNAFYLIFWLAGCLFVLGYLSIQKMIRLDAKYIICFSVSAFSVAVASFVNQIVEEFQIKKLLRVVLDFIVYIFMGLTMFALVVFPFIIKKIDYLPLSNCLTLWSLALIFISTVLKEFKYNIGNKQPAEPSFENKENKENIGTDD